MLFLSFISSFILSRDSRFGIRDSGKYVLFLQNILAGGVIANNTPALHGNDALAERINNALVMRRQHHRRAGLVQAPDVTARSS